MQTKWSDWLAVERAAGRGGIVLSQPSIVRGQAYTLPLDLPGDLTEVTFAGAIYADVANEAEPLASFDVELGAYDPVTDRTLLTLSLPANALDNELPPDSDGNGVGEVVMKLDFTPAGDLDAHRAWGVVILIAE